MSMTDAVSLKDYLDSIEDSHQANEHHPNDQEPIKMVSKRGGPSLDKSDSMSPNGY